MLHEVHLETGNKVRLVRGPHCSNKVQELCKGVWACYTVLAARQASLPESHLEEGNKIRFVQGSDGSSFLLAPLELQAAMLDLLPVPVCLLLQSFHLFKLALG